MFGYYFTFYLLQSQETNFDIIYWISLLCVMAKLRSQVVGVSSTVEETPTSPHSEDKNPSMNLKIVSDHRKGSGDIGTPSIAFATRSVRRSVRLNARVNPVPFSPGSNLEQECPSTTVVN